MFYVCNNANVSSPSKHQPKPQPMPPRNSPRDSSGIYISVEDSAQEQISEYELVEIYTIHSPKRFVHEGHWEVLDEGVGGSLTTHLQEVCDQLQRVNKV